MAAADTQPDWSRVIDELAQQEPIFHRPAFARSRSDFEQLMADDYWEFGASGERYDREFILKRLDEVVPADADAAGWKTSDFGCRRLGPSVYLLTYTLDQAGRITRRSTVWQATPTGWKILFHQGTVVRAG